MMRKAALVLLAAASLSAQVPLGKEAADLRAHLAIAALDRYLETWNSHDPKRWATSLHFPHVRPGQGAFEVSDTPEQYPAGVNFKQTLSTGWHHSDWTARRVLHVGLDQAHVAGSWMRYTEDDRPLRERHYICRDESAWPLGCAVALRGRTERSMPPRQRPTARRPARRWTLTSAR